MNPDYENKINQQIDAIKNIQRIEKLTLETLTIEWNKYYQKNLENKILPFVKKHYDFYGPIIFHTLSRSNNSTYKFQLPEFSCHNAFDNKYQQIVINRFRTFIEQTILPIENIYEIVDISVSLEFGEKYFYYRNVICELRLKQEIQEIIKMIKKNNINNNHYNNQYNTQYIPIGSTAWNMDTLDRVKSLCITCQLIDKHDIDIKEQAYFWENNYLPIVKKFLNELKIVLDSNKEKIFYCFFHGYESVIVNHNQSFEKISQLYLPELEAEVKSFTEKWVEEQADNMYDISLCPSLCILREIYLSCFKITFTCKPIIRKIIESKGGKPLPFFWFSRKTAYIRS